MKKHCWIGIIFAGFFNIVVAADSTVVASNSPSTGPTQRRLAEGLRAHLERLTSSEMEGRLNSSAGYRRAAEYCAQFFASAGLEPGWTGPERKAVFFQPVREGRINCVNVIARLPGSDPKLRSEYITLGAHLDHLGKNWWGRQYPGAIDNASGCAAVLETARVLAAKPPKRTIVFVLFTAEEFGHIGSQQFVKDPPVPLDKISMNVNIEQIGGVHRDYPGIFALGPLSQRSTFEAAGKGVPGIPVAVEDIQNHLPAVRESDTWSFLQHKQPAVILSSGGFPEHHALKDSIALIDFDHLTRASSVIIDYVRMLAGGDEPEPALKNGGQDGPPNRSQPAQLGTNSASLPAAFGR